MALTFQKGQNDKIFITQLTCNDSLTVNKFSVDDVEYYKNLFSYIPLDDGTYSVIPQDKSRLPSELVIPSIYMGKAVTSIGWSAFNDCYDVTKVYIPDTIEVIGESAFVDCTNLREVIIGNKVTSIGGSAFDFCSNLIEVIIPDSVTTIGKWAFRYCTNLNRIIIGKSVTSIGSYAFGMGNAESRKVYFKGTESVWDDLTTSDVGINKDTVYYYSEAKPTTEGNYWHYVDGEIMEWGSACENGHSWVEATCTTPKICSVCGKTEGEALAHAWGDWEITRIQNCNEAGEKTRTCSLCGEQEHLPVGTPIGHDYGDTEIYPPTCTEKGGVIQTCLRCGDRCGGDVPALGHDLILNEGKPPTCTELGWNPFYTCSRCDHSTFEELPATGHTEVIDEAVAPTCIETGLTEGSHCSGCGEVYVAQEEIPALGHDYGEWYTETEATETTQGLKRRDCQRCGHYETDVIPPTALVFTEQADGYSVKTTSTDIEGELIIPATYEGKPVTIIEEKGFENCNKIIGITIPDSVTSIGNDAFHYCGNIINVKIGDSVTSIGYNAFSSCEKIENINIPEGVTVIKDYTFYMCREIADIALPSTLTSIEQFAFCGAKIKTVDIPEGVTIIGDYAFYLVRLESIVLPASLTSIGINAITSDPVVYYKGTEAEWNSINLNENENLQNATRYYYSEEWLGVAGKYWFYDDNGVPMVWETACSKGHTEVIDEAVAPTCKTTGLTEGKHCSVCGEVIVAQEIVDVIDHDYVDGTCSMCGKKYEISDEYFIYTLLDDGTYSIKAKDVDELPKVAIPSEYNGIPVTEIGEEAFYYSHAVNITIPDSVLYIRARAFAGCYDLANLTIGNSVLAIEGYAFAHCENLTHIDLPASLLGITGSAFYDCYGLQSITVAEENPIYYVEDNCLINKLRDEVVFGWGEGTIPEITASIGSGAFYGNTYLAPIRIPLSVTAIESLAFGESENLVVHCVARSKPDGWADDWCDENVEVVWGYAEGDDSCSHSYGGWTTTVQPTCTRIGTMERRCSKCGKVEIAPIDPLGHDYEITQNVAQGCVKDGYIRYTCSRCGDTYTEVIKADGTHSYSATVVAPTCTEQGYTEYICDDCGDTYKDSYTDPLGHSWSEWEEVNPATCEIDGMRERKCIRCGEIETEIIPAEGHDWDIEVEVVEPTCTEGGYSIRRCNNCTQTYKYNFTDALGHNIVDGVCISCNNGKKGVVYYGVAAIPERYNSSFILGLANQTPADSHLESISVKPLASEYIYYCVPTSFGDCAFAYNNFVGGFSLIVEGISVTNAGGRIESYNIYKSNQANLGVNGAITITIKETG